MPPGSCSSPARACTCVSAGRASRADHKSRRAARPGRLRQQWALSGAAGSDGGADGGAGYGPGLAPHGGVRGAGECPGGLRVNPVTVNK